VGGFELAQFQFDRDQSQAAMIEEQVKGMVFAVDHHSLLTRNEAESRPISGEPGDVHNVGSNFTSSFRLILPLLFAVLLFPAASVAPDGVGLE
jgi:hypothetical protein